MQAIGIERFVLIATCTCAAALAGCATTPPPEPEMTISKTPTTVPVAGRARLGEPRSIFGQPVFLVPFAMESTKGLFESSDPFASPDKQTTAFLDSSQTGRYSTSSETSYPSYYAYPLPLTMHSVRWHNAVFHNTTTGVESIVLETRGVIGSWDTLYHYPTDRTRPSVVGHVFVAVVDDTNHDGLLDARDARVAILTDADGQNPRVVSPRDGQVLSLIFDQSSRTLFLTVRSDSSGDGKFDVDDTSIPYSLNLSSREPAKPLVSQATREKLDALVK